MKTNALKSLMLLTLAGSVHSVSAQFSYGTNDGTISIYRYSGPGGDVQIPGTIDGLPVTDIAQYAFSGSSNLTNITITDSVTSIEYLAFSGCTNLANITIPGSVAVLGSGTFAHCTSLERVYYLGDRPWISARPHPNNPDYLYEDSSPTISYFLPGTAGWEDTYGGRPTALWLPEILAAGLGNGAQAGEFGFTIRWAGDRVMVVEASNVLGSPDWAPISTNILVDGSFDFTDPDAANHPARFYRLRWP